MASSSSKSGSKPLLKMPVLAPSKFGSGAKLDPPGGEDGGGGVRTQFPGLKKSKLASLPLVAAKQLAPNSTVEKPDENLSKAGFIPLSNQEPIAHQSPLDRSGSVGISNDSELVKLSFPDAAKNDGESKEEEVFVFGQNLHHRAENFDVRRAEESLKESLKPKDADEAVPRKTLSESAAEYCESHAPKRKFEEVKLVTGEEDETNVVQINAKLHVFEKGTSTWMERGRGLLRLNDVADSPGDANSGGVSGGTSRIVMRTTGSLRVILNTPLFAGMSVEKPTDKTVRLTGTDEGQVKIFLISATPKDIQDLYTAVAARQMQISNQEEPPRKKISN